MRAFLSEPTPRDDSRPLFRVEPMGRYCAAERAFPFLRHCASATEAQQQGRARVALDEARAILAVTEACSSDPAVNLVCSDYYYSPCDGWRYLGDVWATDPRDGNAHAALAEALTAFLDEPEPYDCMTCEVAVGPITTADAWTLRAMGHDVRPRMF